MQEINYMQRALALAKLAEGNTSPNPMVGCVIVDGGGNIIGEGYHHRAGEAHAEVNALEMAGKNAENATVYVTLEPCSHYGRTGPCCKALVESGVKKVVVACLDPNPQVAGKGIEFLRQNGVEVSCGLCKQEALLLNEKFFTWITKKRPFISLKYAMTLDGKIATSDGDSKWITGKEARTYAHLLRKQHDAVLVGIGTVIADDPELTTRMVEGKNPIRIVLDSMLQISLTAKVLNSAAKTIIFTSKNADNIKNKKLSGLPNVEVITVENISERLSLSAVIEILSQKEITSVLVEGGSTIHGDFLDNGLADRIYAFIAPKIAGGKGLTPIGGRGNSKIADSWKIKDISYIHLGADLLITGLRLKE